MSTEEITIKADQETITEAYNAINKRIQEHKQFIKQWGGIGKPTGAAAARETKVLKLQALAAQLKPAQ